MINAVYEFPRAYKRYVGFSLQTDLITDPTRLKVKKTRDGNGFFPDIAASEVFIIFSHVSERVKKYVDLLREKVPNANYEWNESTLHVTFNSIYEFKFFPHNFGFALNKLERTYAPAGPVLDREKYEPRVG